MKSVLDFTHFFRYIDIRSFDNILVVLVLFFDIHGHFNGNYLH
jgi:hypothetical protein